jgi:hypothetical protein
MIVLRVPHSTTGTHVLHAAGADDPVAADAIPMLELTGQDVGDDFHVAMRMGRESFARDDSIVVEDAQRAPIHVLRIVIVRETERVARPKPTMVVVPTISRALHLEDRPNGGNRQRTAFVHALTLAKFVAGCRV